MFSKIEWEHGLLTTKLGIKIFKKIVKNFNYFGKKLEENIVRKKISLLMIKIFQLIKINLILKLKLELL